MDSIRRYYLARTQKGDFASAAQKLAEDLMRGDPVSFKAGYTLANAAIAANEVFPEVSQAQVQSLVEERDIQRELQNGWV